MRARGREGQLRLRETQAERGPVRTMSRLVLRGAARREREDGY